MLLVSVAFLDSDYLWHTIMAVRILDHAYR